jgi:hypothetical protein
MIRAFVKRLIPLALVINLFSIQGYSNIKNPGYLKESADLSGFENHLQGIYVSCLLKEAGLDYQLFKQGVVGFYNIKIKEKDSLSSSNYLLSIIDFEKPSTEKRLWIIDLKNKKLLFHSLVAHGKNTGENKAVNFSNCSNSNMSSIGFYITRNSYIGKHGLSLVIDGLDENFNTNAKSRSVVIHSADYVSEDFIKCNGRLGRSQGCPAIPVEDHIKVINTIKEGSTLYIHYPCSNYSSVYLNENAAIKEFLKLQY